MPGMTRRHLLLAGAAMGLLGHVPFTRAASKYVKLPDGLQVPALGLGTSRLAEGRRPAAEEEEALRAGIAQGMTLLDTAEMYGSGRAEEMVGRVIAGQRQNVYVVSKVLPSRHGAEQIRAACEASLKRLGIDYIDLYLLHWRTSQTDLQVVVNTFEQLRAAGRIRRWGVSNFSVNDMEELLRIPEGRNCATNQVRYNLQDRGIESDLLPWARQHQIPIMAYSPLGQGNLLSNPVLNRVASRHQCSSATIAIAWTLREGGVISIPGSGAARHVTENAQALAIQLDPQDLAELDQEFPVRGSGG